jgi:ATP-dependent helicase/nuclease subunit B
MNTKFIPVSFKNGEIDEKSRKNIYSHEGWEDIMSTVEKAVCDISERIKSGEICATPKMDGKKSRCEWCEFKPICRKSGYL